MYEFDSRQLIDEENRALFIKTICENVTIAQLDKAVTEAQSNHWYGVNQTYLRMACDITVVPFYLRWNRGVSYSSNYESMRFTDSGQAMEITPRELFLCLLEGPTEAVSKGGFGVNSFKWFVLESLANQIQPPLVNKLDFPNEPDVPVIPTINDHAAGVILGELHEHLAQLPAWKSSQNNKM